MFNIGTSWTVVGLGFGALIALILVLTVVGFYQALSHQMHYHGAIPVLWRWFSGGHHHGREPYTTLAPDRNRPHCKRRLHPRLRRIIYRFFFVFLIPWATFAYFVDKPFVWFITSVVCFLLFLETVRHHFLTMTSLRHHRNYVQPVGEAVRGVLHPEPMPSNTGEWVTVDQDYGKNSGGDEEGLGNHPHHAIVDLPRHWNGSDRHKDRIVSIIRETCGMDQTASVVWSLDARNSHVEVRDRQPPPSHVTLRDIEPYIAQATEQDGAIIKNIVIGLGRASAPVKVSLSADSPNIGLSMGPGAGKSQLARIAAAQILHRGGIVIILDIKRISHTWARGLSNVRYAKSVEEIHEALLDLAAEADRRMKIADFHADYEGNLDERIRWPRMLVIVEESNEMMARLRRYWSEIRDPRKDPKQSPAITAYEGCLFMGRQLLINMLAVAQMMTAKASGSGAARENMGVRILGRFSKNNWRMLVPEFEQPARSMHPGRVQVVTTDVHECQVAFITGAEARDYSSSGVVTPFPVISRDGITPDDDGEVVEGVVVEDDPVTTPNHDLPAITSGQSWIDPDLGKVDDPEWVSLRSLLQDLPGKTINVLRNDSKRDPNFPKPHPDKHGREYLYPAEDVLQYYAKKGTRKRTRPID